MLITILPILATPTISPILILPVIMQSPRQYPTTLPITLITITHPPSPINPPIMNPIGFKYQQVKQKTSSHRLKKLLKLGAMVIIIAMHLHLKSRRK